MGLFSRSRSTSNTTNNALELGQQAQGDVGDNQISASNSHLQLFTNDSVTTTNTDNSDNRVTNIDDSFSDSSVTNIDSSDRSVYDASFTDESVTNIDDSYTDNSVHNIDNSVNTDHGAVAAAINFVGGQADEFLETTVDLVDVIADSSARSVGAVENVAITALDELSDSHSSSLEEFADLAETHNNSVETLFKEANSGLASAFERSVDVIAENSKSESERGLDSVIDLSKNTMIGLGVLSVAMIGFASMRKAA